tara:strand:+ start:350 stop:1108 length:759 start_codon:yes stop_codon:yes gene_type:complete
MNTKLKKSNGKNELAEAFAADTGIGFEEVTVTDVQIPFIRIIQALSPQLKKNDPAFIKGAGQGDIFNTVTQQFWDGEEGLLVLPVYFQLKFLEFVPRSQGGGFVGELSADSEMVRTATRNEGIEWLTSGNELVRSAQHYVKIVHENGSLENAIIDMKKTQLKKSRLWNALMLMQTHNGATLPSFANSYRLKTVEDGNDKGSWSSWSVALKGQIKSIENYNEAKNFYASIARGEFDRALPPPDDAVVVDEVPF